VWSGDDFNDAPIVRVDLDAHATRPGERRQSAVLQAGDDSVLAVERAAFAPERCGLDGLEGTVEISWPDHAQARGSG